MISLRLTVPAILASAAVAACFTYFVTPPAARVEADQRLPPPVPNLRDPDTTASTSIDQHPSAEAKTAAVYREAAEAILSQAPNARASAGAVEPPITGAIPMPRRRPVTRP